MALSEIGKQLASLFLARDGKVYAMHYKDKITLTREKNGASKLSTTLLRDQVVIDPGNAIALNLDVAHNAFYGYIVSVDIHDEWVDIEAYDQLYYMNRNKMRFAYENLTAAEVCYRVCMDRGYGLQDPPMLADTVYRIPSRIEENVSDLTIITTALDLTFQNTGTHYYIWDDYGSITISHDGDLAADTNLFITLGYLESYNIHKTLDDCYTAARVEKQIKDSTNTTGQSQVETFTVVDENYVAKYGYLEAFETAEEAENGQHKANVLLTSNYPPNESLSLRGVQGDITCRGGTPVLVDFFSGDNYEYLRGWYTVETVTHTIEDGYHSMDLELSPLVMINDYSNWNPGYYSYPFGII